MENLEPDVQISDDSNSHHFIDLVPDNKVISACRGSTQRRRKVTGNNQHTEGPDNNRDCAKKSYGTRMLISWSNVTISTLWLW